MSGFDDLLDSFDFGDKVQPIKTTPTIVTETIEYGNELINQDYLPQLSTIKKIQPYLGNFKHLNLYEHGWRFQFGTSKSWAGLCDTTVTDSAKSKNRNIYVSIDFVKHDANWKQNMREVILHEISHGLILEIFWGNANHAILDEIDDLHKITKGHGLIWKEVCAALNNADCPVFYKKGDFKESFKDFKYDCANCSHTGYGTTKWFTETCENCKKSVIIEANIN